MILAALLVCLAGQPSFDTIDEAANASLKAAMLLPMAKRYEGAGIILQCGEVYTYAKPQSIHEEYGFELTITPPKGAKLAAIYHTHPGNRGSDRADEFSKEDIAMQKFLRVPSYLYIVRINEVRVLE